MPITGLIGGLTIRCVGDRHYRISHQTAVRNSSIHSVRRPMPACTRRRHHTAAIVTSLLARVYDDDDDDDEQLELCCCWLQIRQPQCSTAYCHFPIFVCMFLIGCTLRDGPSDDLSVLTDVVAYWSNISGRSRDTAKKSARMCSRSRDRLDT